MLARKYNEYAWEEQTQLQKEQEEVARRERQLQKSRRATRNRVLLVVGVVLMSYMISVCRSVTLVEQGDMLVALRHQESQLITKNSNLKIEVEQLKGPERIIGLAEQRLGMNVARSNIYLKGANIKK